MTTFTREQLEGMIDPATRKWYENAPLAAFAIALLDRAETAEKRMKAWGCPDFDFICLNCGRETPCITEADLRPGDPGVPCTFDLTYPQMIERLRHYEDRQRKAEAERDRLVVELEQRRSVMSRLPFCPDHRDKVAGLECRECEVERIKAELEESEEAIRYVAHGDGYDCYRSESSPEPRGVVGYTGVGGVWFAFPDEMQAAVRRARERGGQGKQPLPK